MAIVCRLVQTGAPSDPSVWQPDDDNPAPSSPGRTSRDRGRTWLVVGLAGLVVVLLAGLVGAAVVVLRKAPAAQGAYRAVDDLCGLAELTALGQPKIAPIGGRTPVAGGEDVSCTLNVATGGRHQSATVIVSANIKPSANDAEGFYASYLDMYAHQKQITEVPGLGTKASWFNADGIKLVGYDDNLFLEVSWRPDSAATSPPADLISRLAQVGRAVLNTCRRPGVTPPPTLSTLLPTLPSPSAPMLTYHKVDNLCQVTKFDELGKVKPNTARYDNNDAATLLTMQCTVQLQSQAPGQVQQVVVIALIDTTGRDLGAGFASERQNAKQATDMPGLGSAAFFEPDYIGGPRLLTYQANLQLSVSYFTTNPASRPPDIATRLKGVASSVMDGLRIS